MQASRLPAALLLTSSVYLLHCSSDDTPGDGNNAGTSSAMAGTTSGAGKGGSAGTSTGGAGGSSAGTGGSAGPAGSGGASATGGSAGSGAGGTGATGAGGMTGSAGRGTAGMSGSGMAGSGTAGNGMTGAGGSTAGASGAGGATGGAGGRAAGGTGMGGSSSGAMTLTSTAITEGGMFPAANTCNMNSHQSPDLTWTAGPSGTMSYAVILLDTDNSYNHWVLWDIPASVTSLPAGLDDMAMPAVPAGAKQKALSGNGYFGPCPNGDDHVYKFTVYALPVATLSGAMTSEMTAALAMDVMNANPLASASLSAHSNASMN